MLKSFIYEEHHFVLGTLNSRIENFAYGKKESRSKPSKPLLQSHITGNGKLPFSGLSVCVYIYDAWDGSYMRSVIREY